MKKTNWLIVAFLLMLIVTGWFLYKKITDNAYVGMSIIPEEHNDIPLFKGLKPTEVVYVIDGNQWIAIHDFYQKELPKLGWKLEYEGSELNDNEPGNDWSGFLTRWRKEGFDGLLVISASYNQFEDQTEVIFDNIPIHNSTTWIKNVPESICVYKSLNIEKCSVIKDQHKIKKIVGFINEAMDWNEEILPRKRSSLIQIGDLHIEVHYENEKEIYLLSEKGIKMMKPEPDFFTLTNLSR